jgi:hypothetical protein
MVEAEKLIAKLQGETKELENKLADAGLYKRDPAGAYKYGQRLTAAKKELEAAEASWLELAEDHEEGIARA